MSARFALFDGRGRLRAHREAANHAQKYGEFALLIWHGCPGIGPAVFRKAHARGEPWGKLFHPDADALRKAAKRLKVHRIVVDRPDRWGQHVDLVGAPLARAQALAAPSLLPRDDSNPRSLAKTDPSAP